MAFSTTAVLKLWRLVHGKKDCNSNAQFARDRLGGKGGLRNLLNRQNILTKLFMSIVLPRSSRGGDVLASVPWLWLATALVGSVLALAKLTKCPRRFARL